MHQSRNLSTNNLNNIFDYAEIYDIRILLFKLSRYRLHNIITFRSILKTFRRGKTSPQYVSSMK